MKPHNNPERLGLVIGICIALVGVALIVLPPLLGVDMMRVGYGLSCIGLFVGITGVVTALLYGQRAYIMDRILAGDDILARWEYDNQQSQKQIESEFAEASSRNRGLFLIMLIWFVVIIGAIVAWNAWQGEETPALFIWMMGGIVLLLGAVAYLTPRLWRRRALRAGQQVVISRRGVLLNGALYTWSGSFEKLVNVEMRESHERLALVFTVSRLSRRGVVGYYNDTLTVPVPAEYKDMAQRACSELGRPK